MLKNINWQVRIKNKMFWVALIPALLLVIQAIANVFGIELDFANLSENLIAVVNAIFGVLVILGIVIDPTTKGIEDSERAMQYKEPK